MKILFTLLFLLGLSFSTQEPRIHTGQVERTGEVITVIFRNLPNKHPDCQIAENKDKDECKFTVLDIPKEEYPTRWKVYSVDVNRGTFQSREPEVGDTVKAQGERLVAIESCEVRRDMRKYEWRVNHPGYDRMPLVLNSLPDDCQPWYGKQE